MRGAMWFFLLDLPGARRSEVGAGGGSSVWEEGEEGVDGRKKVGSGGRSSR